MSKTFGLLCGVLVLLGGNLNAQQYRCDWSVNGIGGGEMSSSAYRCDATVGQTAAGRYQSLLLRRSHLVQVRA
jgi:hypothetical protein